MKIVWVFFFFLVYLMLLCLFVQFLFLLCGIVCNVCVCGCGVGSGQVIYRSQLYDKLVILDNKSATPIPHQHPPSLQTSLRDPGESGVLGGGMKKKQRKFRNSLTYPNLAGGAAFPSGFSR